MPELRWSEYDIIECLGVLPIMQAIHEAAVYEFVVIRDGLRLTMTVWRWESVIILSLGTDSQAAPAIEWVLFVRGAITRRDEAGEDCLQISDCILAPSRFSAYDRGDFFDRGLFPHGETIQVSIQPHIVVTWLR